jgi:hypothetical protein
MRSHIVPALTSGERTVRILLGEYSDATGSCGTVGIHSAMFAIMHPREANLTQVAKANTAQIVRLGVVAMGKMA